MPIRILHIVTYMGRGGLETMLMNYYRSIDRTRVQFDFLVHRDFEADYDAEILSLGGKIHRLPQLNPLSRGYLSALDSFFGAHPEYRIVHCHLDCMAGIPLKYAKKHGVPVRIAHAHSSSQAKDKKYLLKMLYKQMIPGQATELFACSEEAGRFMFGGHTFRVLNNAVDARSFAFSPAVRAQYRRELEIPEDALVVGHIGRFDGPKNQAFLLDVLQYLPDTARLLLVGDGKLRTEVRDRAVAMGFGGRVILTGVRGDVKELMQAMDVFAFPSLFEGLPVSIVEAQAAGLPCLISDGVPIECKKTDLVSQLPLSAGAEAWAKAVLDAAGRPRVDTLAQIRKAGFDIEENAAWLAGYYLDQSGAER